MQLGNLQLSMSEYRARQKQDLPFSSWLVLGGKGGHHLNRLDSGDSNHRPHPFTELLAQATRQAHAHG